MPELVEILEVCRITSLSRSSVYRCIRRGDFPRPAKIGVRRMAWSRAEVANWAEGKLAGRDPSQDQA
jgi:prophage regulatory protein